MSRPIPELTPREEGLAALERGAWLEAVAFLEEAVAGDETDGRAWESLGQAYTWLTRSEPAIAARQRAYALYRERGDDADAARVCLDLVWDYLEVRGEPAVANGWFQRARRLLDGLPPAPEHALLEVFHAYLAIESDPEQAASHSAEAARMAAQVGAAGIGCLALALQGLALVTQGRVREGMSLLDEAVAGAIGRDITDPQWFYFTCCCMIDACDGVRDYSRSLAWCVALRGFAERWGIQAFLTTCRVKYTGALLWRGEWAQYEAEIEQAMEELERSRPAAVAGALVRLAELRRRQGLPEAAEEILQRAPANPQASVIRIGLALDAGDGATAASLADALLRRTPATMRTERPAAMELLVRAHVLCGELETARTAAGELEEIAHMIDTSALRAAATAAWGTIAAASADHDQACRLFEDAAHLYEESGSPHEAARARLELAASRASLQQPRLARAEAAAALGALEAIGAAADARRARELIACLPAGPETAPDKEGREVLTRRQSEVLALAAQGLTEREIASQLFLSEHTVHRHMANILRRLGASSRTAAVARGVRDGLI